jgi:hypothetical protein
MRANQVQRWLIDAVTLGQASSVDEFGQPTTTTEVVPAKILRSHSRSVDATGTEFVSTTQVALLKDVSVGDTLTIDGVTRPVRAVKAAVGVRGGVAFRVALL